MKNNKLFAVAGYPVFHSKSPLIFNSLFSAMEIPGHYSRISARSGEEVFEMFEGLELSGINVTSPLKSEIFALTKTSDSSSAIIGGVNTLVNENGNIKGHNTDHSGVSESFVEENIDVKGKKCLVLGAESAGRAAAYALTRSGGDVSIINRTFKKAHILAGDMDCNAVVFEKLQSEIAGSDIFVSTISSGTEIIKAGWLRKDTIIFDAVYKSSILSKTASAAGCRIISGERWLLNQAIPAFRIFTGKDVIKKDKDKLSRILRDHDRSSSGLILMGKREPAENIKNRLAGLIEDMEISIATDPEEIAAGEKNFHPKSNPIKILVYSGAKKEEIELFPFSDLIVWGKGGVEETAQRVKVEIEHAR